MSEKGKLGKQAIEACKDVYKGMRGKYNTFAALEGEKIIKSNMTQSQIDRIEKVADNAFKKGILKNGKKVYGDEASLEARKIMKNKINTVNSLPYALGDNIAGGLRDTRKSFKKSGDLKFDERLKTSLDKGFRKNVLDDAGNVVGRELDVGRTLGASFGTGVAARVVSGGGLYKDTNGNVNLPGIPFL